MPLQDSLGAWSPALGAAAVAALVAASSAGSCGRVGRRIGQVDGEVRDPRGRPVPRTGGLSLLLGWLAGLGTLAAWTGEQFWYSVAAGVAAWTIGMHDDRVQSSPALRLLLLGALATGWVMLDGPIGVGGFPIAIQGAAARAFTVLALLSVVVAFDFADGIDGYVLVLVIVAAAAAGATGAPLLGAALGLLLWALPPAHLHLGDNGSNLAGLAVAAILIGPGPSWEPARALLPVALVLVDLASTVLRRLRRGPDPFARDRLHVHHRLAARLGSRGALVAAASLALVGAIAGAWAPDPLVLLLWLGAAACVPWLSRPAQPESRSPTSSG
jgi:UDP-GlcNAc:undecaprenyl-phosphate GlcNAc-1-phosphate transferase